MPDFQFVPKVYPTKPGCYIMKNKTGRVMYVGKAKNLRRRLSSYFQPSLRNRKAKRMIRYVQGIEVIIVNNEYESLVLENNLIKKYKPWFNRVMKKSTSGYYYIQMTGEEFPRFLRYRKNRYVKAVDGLREVSEGIRFGPYLKSQHREVILEYVNDNFRLRTCKPLGHQVCLRFHLGRCSGICERKVSEEEYTQQVNAAIRFLRKPEHSLLEEMAIRMQEHAAHLEFEKAQKIKEQMQALQEGLQKQIVETDANYDQAVIYFGKEGALVASVKQGALQGMELLPLPAGCGFAEACRRLLLAKYSSDCPEELLVSHLSNPTSFAEGLATKNGKPVRISVPKSGLGAELIRLCQTNYRYRVSSAAAGNCSPTR